MAELIKIYCNYVEGGWSPNGVVYGSEEGVCETSKLLADKGYEVIVYMNGFTGLRDGVYFLPQTSFEPNCDVLIIFKDNEQITIDNKKNCRKMIYWTNEVDIENKLNKQKIKLIDNFVAHSPWQIKNTMSLLPNTIAIPLGYYQKNYYPEPKNKYQCVFASSPDRGLPQLLEYWPKIKTEFPQAILKVAYKNGNYSQSDGVDYLGGLVEKDMAKIYLQSEFWLYPCTGIELFCLTAIKAQVAGAIPIIFPYMALQETVKFGIKTDEANFIKETILLFKDKTRQNKIRKQISRHHFITWEETIPIWENLWKKL